LFFNNSEEKALTTIFLMHQARELRILLVMMVFISLAGYVCAEELKTKIDIASEHQICETDGDCTDIKTDCTRMDCVCAGQPLNKIYIELYREQMEECWDLQQQAGNLIIACDMMCGGNIYSCVNSRCKVEATPYEQPSLRK